MDNLGQTIPQNLSDYIKFERKPQTNVCLSMIAKNEARRKLIPALLAAAPHITGYMFCDTGSTDHTPELARHIFDILGIPGAVDHHVWKDFSSNRNLCMEKGLELLGSGMCQYWLLLDADQIMVSTDGLTFLSELKLTADFYWLRELCHGTEVQNSRIVSTGVKWEYVGRIHEYIRAVEGQEDTEGSEGGTLPPQIYSIHDSDWNRGFDGDAKLLEEAVAEDPTDARSRFYLGNTYRDLERWEDAIVQYAERIKLQEWDEEIYIAALEASKAMEMIVGQEQLSFVSADTWSALLQSGLIASPSSSSQEEESTGKRVFDNKETRGRVPVEYGDVLAMFSVAHTILPYRKEALYNMAHLMRTIFMDNDACAQYARKALVETTKEENEWPSLFVDLNVGEYHVYDEMCACGYYANDNVEEMHEAGKKACEYLIHAIAPADQDEKEDDARASWQQDMRKRALTDLEWYVKREHAWRNGER